MLGDCQHHPGLEPEPAPADPQMVAHGTAQTGVGEVLPVTAPISIIAIRPTPGTTSVKAFVDLQVGGFQISNAKIVQQPGGAPWLAMPSTKTDRGWSTPVEIVSRPLRDRITEIAIAAWQAALASPTAPPARDRLEAL